MTTFNINDGRKRDRRGWRRLCESLEKLSDDRLGQPSAAIRERVEAARARQAARFAGTRMLANADAPGVQGLGRERYGTFAGWTTSLQDRDRQEPA